jgi:hypothetical protein
MIQLTPEAARHLIKLRRERGLDGTNAARLVRNAERVSLAFAPKAEPGDRPLHAGEIDVFISHDLAVRLDGSTIDARTTDGRVALIVRRKAVKPAASASAPEDAGSTPPAQTATTSTPAKPATD